MNPSRAGREPLTSDCIPVDAAAVAAAVRIFERIPYAPEHDDILRRAGAAFSANSYPDVLARVILLNQLYGTRLLAVGPMAAHICSLRFSNIPEKGWVDAIADLPSADGSIQRRMVSFASKYAHFFIDPMCFHISDDAAREVLARHWRVAARAAHGWDFAAYNENVETLRVVSSLPADRTLDRYLWIAGMHLRSRRPKNGEKINRNLAAAFAAPECAEDLRVLIGAVPPPPKRAHSRQTGATGPVRRTS